MIVLTLTCAHEEEADQIISALLAQKLIAAAHKQSVATMYTHDGQIHSVPEVLVTMETAASRFEKIEAVVRQHHSYSTFVLTAVATSHTSKGVNAWLNRSLQ